MVQTCTLIAKYGHIYAHTKTLNHWSEPITYFLYFGFGKKAAGTFCWIMAALISPLYVFRSLAFLCAHPSLPLSLSARMVLVFISSVLGACWLPKLFVRSVFKCVCVCVYVSARHFLFVCVNGIYFLYFCGMKAERRNASEKTRYRESKKCCEVLDISPTNPAGCETSQLSDLTSLRGIHSFFLSLFSSSSFFLFLWFFSLKMQKCLMNVYGKMKNIWAL